MMNYRRVCEQLVDNFRFDNTVKHLIDSVPAKYLPRFVTSLR